MSDSLTPVGVIGAGLAGLTAACTLAARGYRVVLFERNDWPGGKAAVHCEDGYRFDMGPTILTVPSVLRRVFAEAGRDLAEEVRLLPLEPQWRCFFEDGSRLDLHREVARMAAALDEFAPSRKLGDGYRKLMSFAQKTHAIGQRYAFYRPVGSLRDIAGAGGGWNASLLADLLRIHPWQTVASAVRSRLSDARAAQMADHFTQYVGSNPFKSPAVLCSIAHMQMEEGVWYPEGGIAAVPSALHRLAASLGVESRMNCSVRRIELEGGRVAGVQTEAGTVKVAAVISNCDAETTYGELLRTEAGAPASPSWPERACSGVVLYLGLDYVPDHLSHHNFVFSRDPHEEYDAIYERGEPAPDPTCYVCAPARTEPGVAPPGCEALYVLVHAPYLRPGQDWTRMMETYRETIFGKLERTAGLSDLESHVVAEAVLTPAGIRERYAAPAGAIYGFASHGRLSGALKPGNRRSDLPGLYLAGGSAHPGPGMPMVMMSGWIAADTLDRDGLAGKAS